MQLEKASRHPRQPIGMQVLAGPAAAVHGCMLYRPVGQQQPWARHRLQGTAQIAGR